MTKQLLKSLLTSSLTMIDMINRYQRLACTLILFTCVLLINQNQVSAKGNEKPNIVLIFVDDLGYGDLSCYGSQLVPTPNIDKIAAAGIKFIDGYASSATCGPSRLGIMTGKYQQRIGGYSNTTSRTVKIPQSYLLMPQMLKAAGYRTAHIGKWHINHPVKSVFDEVYNEIGGLSEYFPDEEGLYVGVDGHKGTKRPHGWVEVDGLKSITELHGDAAVNFIKKEASTPNPFFLYLAFNAPHSPWQARLEDRNNFDHISPEVMQVYASMIQTLDQNIGRVMQQLEDSGMAENTLVVLASDNGPEWGRDYIPGWPENWAPIIVGSAGPFSGRKAEFLEGGIRVPFMMRWPGKLEAGTAYTRPVTTRDLYNTFAAVAGYHKKTESDGVNILPYLSGKKSGDPHEILFWQGGADRPVFARMGDWKIEVPGDNPPKLYKLDQDIGEKQNIADQNPGIVKELVGLVENWLEEIKSI